MERSESQKPDAYAPHILTNARNDAIEPLHNTHAYTISLMRVTASNGHKRHVDVQTHRMCSPRKLSKTLHHGHRGLPRTREA